MKVDVFHHVDDYSLVDRIRIPQNNLLAVIPNLKVERLEKYKCKNIKKN